MKFLWKKKLAILLAFIFVFSASIFVFKDKVSAQSNCSIDATSTKFRPAGVQPPQYGASNPYSFPAGGFSQTDTPFVYVDVKTLNCQGQIVIVKLIDASDNDYNEVVTGWGPPSISNDAVMEAATVAIGPASPNATFTSVSDDFTLTFKAGENECNAWPGAFDCEVAAVFFKYPSTLLHSEGQALWYPPAPGTPLNQKIPALSYECDDLCADATAPNWKVIEVLPYGGTNAAQAQTIQANSSSNPTNPYYPTFSDSYLAPILGNEVPGDLGGYLANIFQVLIVIAGILAFVKIVLGAIQYMTSEAMGAKSAGINSMKNAIFGLILALGAWVVLNTINPNLASNLGFNLPHVSLDGDADYFGGSSTSFGDGTITGNTLPTDLGLVCPGSGGSESVASIVDSFRNKTTYRWGGKGGPLAPGQSFPSSPAEDGGSNPHMCTNDAGQSVPCRSFCPSESVCLDCSGFVNHVRSCAGLQTFSGTSSMVGSSSAIPINLNQNLSSDGSSIVISGVTYAFVPGDILVWNGHVVIYYGNGKVAEALGSKNGMLKNNNIKISSITKYKNRITHLIKVQ
ncbi:MAG: NlpC/P60 protein [Patescibacteria group bacterium]|nr:NlpC/P60 protein [Patescibacteria group bacterium]